MTNQNTYDYVNRLTGRLSAVLSSLGPAKEEASGGGGSALNFNYHYNAAGQRTQITLLDD